METVGGSSRPLSSRVGQRTPVTILKMPGLRALATGLATGLLLWLAATPAVAVTTPEAHAQRIEWDPEPLPHQWWLPLRPTIPDSNATDFMRKRCLASREATLMEGSYGRYNNILIEVRRTPYTLPTAPWLTAPIAGQNHHRSSPPPVATAGRHLHRSQPPPRSPHHTLCT